MPIHLYCLLRASADASPPPDIEVVHIGEIAAWTSRTDQPRAPRDIREGSRAVIEHDRIVGAALGAADAVIPATMSDPYDSTEALRADIAAHADRILAALVRVDGMVEMTTLLSAIEDAPSTSSAGAGRAYLESLRTRGARAAEAARSVARSLPWVSSQVRSPGDGRSAVSHLIPRGDVARYRELMERLPKSDARAYVDGPRATYSFAVWSPRRGMILAD